MINIITHEKGNKQRDFNINEIDSSCFIAYYPKYFDTEFINNTRDYCESLDEFRGGMSSFGKAIPRLQRWYQMDGHYFSPTWREKYPRWESFPYDNSLLNIQTKINIATNHLLSDFNNLAAPNFNSCLINYYRGENDSIKPHSDSVEVFGSYPTIAILSIGETRDIYFKRKLLNKNCPQSLRLDNENKHLNSKISLEDGSLLIMAGATQQYYLHEIPKVDVKKGGRYSLTFREYQI